MKEVTFEELKEIMRTKDDNTLVSISFEDSSNDEEPQAVNLEELKEIMRTKDDNTLVSISFEDSSNDEE